MNMESIHRQPTLWGNGVPGPQTHHNREGYDKNRCVRYGALVLELATRGRPIKPQRNVKELVLVDCVRELHSQEAISKAIDPRLEEYKPEEAELVLGLVLLCSHPNPDYGPSTRRVVQFSLGDANLPQLPHDLYLEAAGVITDYSDIYADDSDPSCGRGTSSTSTSFAIFDKKVFSKQATRVTF
ncbi:L-type lectin-domain containing receptor kinase VIII.2 [Camellia lanceoleosa]|uniref:L-type lectin-domain containing receptor kinase VIII.2 n=1 Tax=Camellia lanceoleosa TaxID=1840588 RepID=A0ACC0IQV6_9ERIC|nr:L-type lectin-domain containing receptor kinase VIII.2 [Camellia lanceoleosa]